MNLARAQDIRLDNLDNGPGILPFKLGPTKIVSHHHTFLESINLKFIQQQIDLTKSQVSLAAKNITNDNLVLFKYQVVHLFQKLDKISVQLDSLQPTRSKRGLFNPLGSFIKSITGNLDQNDAQKYESIIQILQKNENGFSDSFNKHVTLFKEFSNQQVRVLKSLSSNQAKLEKDFQNFADSTFTQTEQLMYYAHMSQLFSLISENIDDLSDEISRLENVLAFSRTGTMHHSLLSNKDISEMISKLSTIYGPDEIVKLDLRYYFDLITLGSYFVDKNIVIVLKFPITTTSSYDLFKLCPVPNLNHEIILPPFPYIATNSKEFAYLEAECPKIDTWFICEQSLQHQTRTQSDCIYQLIHQQEIDKSCNPTSVSLSNEALTELDDRHYVISFPKPTKVDMICTQENHEMLHGSFLATIPRNCSMRTPKFTIVNIGDKIRGQPVEIITPLLQSAISSPVPEKPHYNFTTIDLNKLHDIQKHITMEVPVNPASSFDLSTYHTTIPMYSFIILSASALVIAYCLRFRRNNRTHNITHPSNIEMASLPAASCSTSNVTSNDSQTTIMEEMKRKDAIFALNIGK